MRIATLLLALSPVFFFSCKSGKGTFTDEEKGTDYSEPHRPQFHFSPEKNWMNDPNGMVYLDGEYHLFYQYYPDSNIWGPMHWGHAVSTDMVHWEHLPIALYPDSLGYIFSGSAVIDHENTSGLGTNSEKPMVALFTHHNILGEKAGKTDFQSQSVAYSLDKGRTWKKYQHNPVIPNPGIKDFRDPKVFWYAPGKKWVLVLAAYDKVMLYDSPDLLHWKNISSFGIPGDQRLWECPDLFPMKDTDTGEEKWVLLVSIQQEAPNGGTATGYFVGSFDGQTFTADPSKQKWLDYGTDNYALVSWSGIPASDGRRLALGWMSNWQYAQKVPTQKWRSAMTLPRRLTLQKMAGDYYIISNPVQELATIEKAGRKIAPQSIAGVVTLTDDSLVYLHKLTLQFRRTAAGSVSVKCSNKTGDYIRVGYDGEKNNYFIDRTRSGTSGFSKEFPRIITAPVHYNDSTISMELYLDKSAVELFADHGKTTMTAIHFPSSPFTKIELQADGGVELLEGEIKEIESIWKKKP